MKCLIIDNNLEAHLVDEAVFAYEVAPQGTIILPFTMTGEILRMMESEAETRRRIYGYTLNGLHKQKILQDLDEVQDKIDEVKEMSSYIPGSWQIA